jgi:hypothetical protein
MSHSRLADELAVVGGEGDDVVENVEADWLFAVSPADVQVSQLAQVAQRHVAAHVDDVLADAPMRLVDERVRLCFGSSVVDVGSFPIDPAVRSHLVVITNGVI